MSSQHGDTQAEVQSGFSEEVLARHVIPSFPTGDIKHPQVSFTSPTLTLSLTIAFLLKQPDMSQTELADLLQYEPPASSWRTLTGPCWCATYSVDTHRQPLSQSSGLVCLFVVVYLLTTVRLVSAGASWKRRLARSLVAAGEAPSTENSGPIEQIYIYCTWGCPPSRTRRE